MKTSVTLFFLLAIAISISGCKNVYIKNIPKQSVNMNKKDISNEKLFKAIQNAGFRYGWIVKKVDNNTAIATLNIRAHQAVVIIKYTSNAYSIQYKSSSNLKYDPEDKTIHRSYNTWISNLSNSLKLELSRL